MSHRKKRTFYDDYSGLFKIGLGITVGSVAASKLGAPAGIQGAFRIGASFLPVASFRMMTKHTLGYLKPLKKGR